MSKYKYAIINGNTITLCNIYESRWISQEDLIENPSYTIKNGILTLKGDLVIDDFNHYNSYNIDEIDEDCIETYKTWFGFGKEKKKVKNGWIILKKRKSVKYTYSQFKLIEEK